MKVINIEICNFMTTSNKYLDIELNEDCKIYGDGLMVGVMSHIPVGPLYFPGDLYCTKNCDNSPRVQLDELIIEYIVNNFLIRDTTEMDLIINLLPFKSRIKLELINRV